MRFESLHTVVWNCCFARFAIWSKPESTNENIVSQLKKHVVNEIGPIAKPDEIKFTDALPKTRSGKIMRRILRALASGDEISGDTSTLEDRSVLDRLRS